MEFDLQEELEGLQDLSTYEITNDYDFEEDEPGPILAGHSWQYSLLAVNNIC
jgi:hypothetical protein